MIISSSFFFLTASIVWLFFFISFLPEVYVYHMAVEGGEGTYTHTFTHRRKVRKAVLVITLQNEIFNLISHAMKHIIVFKCVRCDQKVSRIHSYGRSCLCFVSQCLTLHYTGCHQKICQTRYSTC